VFCQLLFRVLFSRVCQASLGKLPSDLRLILSTAERGPGGICATMVEARLPL